MVLYFYYHILCNFKSSYVISFTSEAAISTKPNTLLFKGVFHINFSVKSHFKFVHQKERGKRFPTVYYTLKTDFWIEFYA